MNVRITNSITSTSIKLSVWKRTIALAQCLGWSPREGLRYFNGSRSVVSRADAATLSRALDSGKRQILMRRLGESGRISKRDREAYLAVLRASERIADVCRAGGFGIRTCRR